MSASALWTAVHYRAPMLCVNQQQCHLWHDEKHQIEVARDRNRPHDMHGSDNAWSIQRSITAITARSYGAWPPTRDRSRTSFSNVLRDASHQVENQVYVAVS